MFLCEVLMRMQLCVICVWVLFLVVLFAGGCRLVLFFMREGSLYLKPTISLLAIHRKLNFFQDYFKLPANFVAGCPRISLCFYCQPLISSPFALSASDASICNLTQRGQRWAITETSEEAEIDLFCVWFIVLKVSLYLCWEVHPLMTNQISVLTRELYRCLAASS